MSEIQEQDHSESCQGISAPLSAVPVTAGAIEMMRSDSLELLDEYDAAALQLGRMQIPLKKKWEAYQAVTSARLKEMVELHDRARAARLSTELGEGKFSEAQIRRIPALSSPSSASLLSSKKSLIF